MTILLLLALAQDVDILKQMLEDAAAGRGDLRALAATIQAPELRAQAEEAVEPILRAAALHRRTSALARELAERGARAVVQPGGPAWLRERVGDGPLRLFDRLTEVSLYMRVDAHAEDYKLNAAIRDAWLERLAELPDLRRLDLENTDVRGPGLKAVGTLAGLEALNLTLCPVTDEGFVHLAGLTRLKSLGLASTKATGAGLRHCDGLRALENLNCHNAPVDDAGLACIAGIPSLVRLEIVHTKFTDAGAAALAKLVNLERLQLGSRTATGAALAALAGLPKLAELDLHDGMWSPEGARHAAAALKTLRVLRAYGGKAGDEGLALLAGHPAIETLRLESTGVTDAGLEALAGLPRLKTLQIRESRVTEAGLARLREKAPRLAVSR